MSDDEPQTALSKHIASIVARERRRAASLVKHVAHSCGTREHCAALHAAHDEAARRILDGLEP
jgi:hypothetical protein